MHMLFVNGHVMFLCFYLRYRMVAVCMFSKIQYSTQVYQVQTVVV